jgi:hypothetical protein
MDNLINSLSKYTGLTVDDLTTAFEAIQDDYKEDVEEQFHKLVEIGYDSDEEGNTYRTIEADKFLDWLFDSYNLEAI